MVIVPISLRVCVRVRACVCVPGITIIIEATGTPV